jgi:FixJ family two-component response regulator
VLDLQMPGRSGLDLQSMLEGTALEVPIVFLTAHGSVAAGVQAMKRGAVDFLEKPVDPPVLIEAVGLQRARAAQLPDPGHDAVEAPEDRHGPLHSRGPPACSGLERPEQACASRGLL